MPAGLDRVRRKLAGSDDGDRQMVKILAAVLTDGLPAVEAACLQALSEGVHSADVVINILARQRRGASPYPDQRRIADVADLSLGRLNWAVSPPTGAASGVTGTCGIVAVAFRGWTPEYSGRAPLIAPTYDYDTPWIIRRSQPA